MSSSSMSLEVDVLPMGDDPDEVDRLGDEIESVAGEFSPFDELHGFCIDGIGLGTGILPDGWRDRLVRVQNANTAASTGDPRFIGWRLDKEDLCVAKLCAHREKDLRFVAALLEHQLVDVAVVKERLTLVPAEQAPAAELARSWLMGRHGTTGT